MTQTTQWNTGSHISIRTLKDRIRQVSRRYGLHVFIAVSALSMLFFQIEPLFWMRPFYVDWINNVWIVGYYSTYLVEHHYFPLSIDAHGGFGNPMPLFYGFILYPLMAITALFVGADGAVRAICSVLFILAFVSVFITSYYACRNALYAAGYAVIANCSVYQLTNLYARSAVAEFCAEQFLIVGLSWIILAIISRSKLSFAAAFFGAACMCFALGSHPITAYLFAIFFAPIFFGCYIILSRMERRSLSVFILALIPIFVVLSPWIYNVVKFRKMLNISSFGHESDSVTYFPDTIDSVYAKLNPIAVDTRVFFEGIARTSTPFLEAPLPFIILALVFYLNFLLIIKISKKTIQLTIPVIFTTGILVYLSLPLGYKFINLDASSSSSIVHVVAKFARDLLTPIQFAYRLTNTTTAISVAALLLTLSVFRVVNISMDRTRRHDKFLVSVLIVAVASLAVKYTNTQVEYSSFPNYVVQSDPSLENSDFLRGEVTLRVLLARKYWDEIGNQSEYPIEFTAINDYAMPKLFDKTISNDMEVVKILMHAWDKAEEVSCRSECLIDTDIVGSAFAKIFLDGHEAINLKVSPLGLINIPTGPGHHSVLVRHRGRSRWVAAAMQIFSILWLLMSASVVFTVLCFQYKRFVFVAPRIIQVDEYP